MRFSNLVAAIVCLAVAGGASMGASAGTAAQSDFSDGLAAYDGGDYRTAFEEWRALAEAGDPIAQTALAGLYLDGYGTPADPGQALRWYRRAAELGHAVAQQNLGDLYERGVGARRDLVSAYVWLSLAAGQGRRWAVWRRDEVARQLAPEALAEAKARLDAWRKGR